MTTSLFNVRIEDDVIDLIKAQAESDGVKPSVWVREVLGSVVLGGVTMDQLSALVEANGKSGESPHPARFLAVQAVIGRRSVHSRGCIHPVHLRRQMPFTEVCGGCGEVVKRG